MGPRGATDDAGILEARHRRSKAMLATLLLSQGVPMILAGDEFGQTQGGNNNTYAQDSEISWLDWDRADKRLVDAVAALSAFRREVGLADSRFARGPGEGEGPEVSWLGATGPMGEGDWGGVGPLGVRYHRAESDLLIVLNPGDEAAFTLPDGHWRRRIDSARDPVVCDMIESGEIALGWQSVAVWQEVAG